LSPFVYSHDVFSDLFLAYNYSLPNPNSISIDDVATLHCLGYRGGLAGDANIGGTRQHQRSVRTRCPAQIDLASKYQKITAFVTLQPLLGMLNCGYVFILCSVFV
jgi:hypothetical protein